MIDVKRYEWLDMAKGIGIILVVMGHTLFPIHSAIDVFHMPLFFILAGLTLKVTKMDVFLLKKIDSIFIPYIFFSLVSVPISYVVPHESIFNGPLWFLETLFIALILAQLVISVAETHQSKYVTGGGILVIVVVSWVLIKYNSQNMPFNIDRAFRVLPFVLFGYMTKDVMFMGNKGSHKYALFFVSLLTYVIAFFAYFSLYNPKGNFKMGEIMQPCLPLFYLSALGGSFAVISLCKIVDRIKIINWLGCNSLIIMCVHFPLAQWLNTYVSQTSYYLHGGAFIKVIMSISIVSLCLCFGALCAFVCKRYIPKLAGYKRNFLNI